MCVCVRACVTGEVDGGLTERLSQENNPQETLYCTLAPTQTFFLSLSLCLTLSFCLSVSLPVLLNLFSAIFCTTGKQGESNSRETTNISHLVLLKPLSRVSFFFCPSYIDMESLGRRKIKVQSKHEIIPNVA